MRQIFKFISLLAVLFGAGYVLNFVWETLHAVYLYQGHDMAASRYVPMLIYVSAVDGVLILALYGWVASLWRDLFWMRKPGALVVFILSAMVLAAAIEYTSVYVLNRWSYLPAMPELLGIGISPLLQLALTGIIAIKAVQGIQFPRSIFRIQQ